MSQSSQNPNIINEIKESEENDLQHQANSGNFSNQSAITSPINDIQPNSENPLYENALVNYYNNLCQSNNSLPIKLKDESHKYIKKYSQSEKVHILNILSEKVNNGIKMEKIKQMIEKNDDEDKDFFIIEQIINLNLLNQYPLKSKNKKKNNSKAVNYQHCIACFILNDRDDVKYDCKNRTKNYLYNHFILCNEDEKLLFSYYQCIKGIIKKINLKLENLQIVTGIMKARHDAPTNEVIQKCLANVNEVSIVLNKIFEMKDNHIVRFATLEEILHNAIGY